MEESSPKMRADNVIFKITTLRKQSPIGRKFAQSGHPDPHITLSKTSMHQDWPSLTTRFSENEKKLR
jgi:hypothetical protein